MIDHWVKELPEFGVSLTIISKLDEKREMQRQIETADKRLTEIEAEIWAEVKKFWSDEDIARAKNAHLFNAR